MFKAGERVRLTDKCQYLGAHYGYKVGDIGFIEAVERKDSVVVEMENPKNGYTSLWCVTYELEHAEKTPPQKITQNGYEYSLVGPVKPEWLVDGAWVVRKDNGETHQIHQQSENCFSATSSFSRVTGLTAKRVSEEFRPHEPKDWKWGDWAMYDGKRVFVMRGADYINNVAISGIGLGCTGNNNTYVNPTDLTPTF